MTIGNLARDLKALPVLRRAEFTTVERMAWRRATRKIGNDLTAAECRLIIRYYEAIVARHNWATVTLGGYRLRLARLEAAQ